jgi:hypothetical protein
MQLRDPMTTVSFIKTNKPVDPHFMGLLIATMLIAMVCSSILISLLFQRYLVAAPIIVRGGQVYPITSGGKGALWQLNSSGTWVPVSNGK